MYELRLNDEQLRVVQSALSFYFRSFLGQLDLWHGAVDGEMLSLRESGLVEMVFRHVMGLGPGESFGLAQERVPDEARVVADIHDVIRHERWKNRVDRTHHTVDSYPPFQGGSEPLCECKAVD